MEIKKERGLKRMRKGGREAGRYKRYLEIAENVLYHSALHGAF